jgi:phytoene synthase
MRNETPAAACRNILKRSKSNFAPAFRVLPTAERNALTAFYAFCRLVDDAVDQADDMAAAENALGGWWEKIDAVYRGEPEDPVCEALCSAVDEFGIRRAHLELILEGVSQDLTVRRFEDFADLYDYCFCVASAVGLVCVEVLGEYAPDTELYAELCGIAVQLTNIIRDVGEDADQNRIYLPLEELDSLGVKEDDLLNKRMTGPVKNLLRFEAVRARSFYDMSLASLAPQKRSKLYFTESLREIYSRLLDNLVEEDFPVFSARVSLKKRHKLSILVKHRLHLAGLWGSS